MVIMMIIQTLMLIIINSPMSSSGIVPREKIFDCRLKNMKL